MQQFLCQILCMFKLHWNEQSDSFSPVKTQLHLKITLVCFHLPHPPTTQPLMMRTIHFSCLYPYDKKAHQFYDDNVLRYIYLSIFSKDSDITYWTPKYPIVCGRYFLCLFNVLSILIRHRIVSYSFIFAFQLVTLYFLSI